MLADSGFHEEQVTKNADKDQLLSVISKSNEGVVFQRL